MQSPTRLFLPLLFACLFAGACGGWRGHGDTYYAGRFGQGATFGFDQPGPDWKPSAHLKDVQVAWVHRKLPATIQIHSDCEGHGDSLLPEFLDHLRIGWTQWNVIEEERGRLVGREYLRAIVGAELDGVQFRHEFVLFKKNGCLFDLTYSARPDVFPAGRDDFHRVVGGFRFPVGKG